MYINWKLFSKADATHHKIWILLKKHFLIYKRISSIGRAQQFQIVLVILDVAYIEHQQNTYQGIS